jgi:Lar family restriction alleviation protein|tara:strand:- start:144 stop:743 length:600 start_codon:yes stop_codon:yes gene_type:complete
MRVVAISGFFNPLHKGHIDYIISARNIGDFLIVIVNTDEQVKIKGSAPFMLEAERLEIIRNIKGVDRAVIAIDKDGSVCETLRQEFARLQKDPSFNELLFANGGDRKEGGVPEDILTKELGINMVYNVGGEKTQSSSKLIEKSVDKDNTKLPCPFCGGQPQAQAMDSVGLYWYECDSCEASCGGTEDWAEATKKWNKRI